MPQTIDPENVPPDIEAPNSIVTVYNPNDEDFSFHWNGEKYDLPAKKEIQMIKFIAVHGAHHLAKSTLMNEAKAKELQFRKDFPKEDNPEIGGVSPEAIKTLSESILKDPGQAKRDRMAHARSARGKKKETKEEAPFADLDRNF